VTHLLFSISGSGRCSVGCRQLIGSVGSCQTRRAAPADNPHRAVNLGVPDAVAPRSHQPWQPRRAVASPPPSQQGRCPHPLRGPARLRPMDRRGRPLPHPPPVVADKASGTERHASRNHDRCNHHRVNLVGGPSPVVVSARKADEAQPHQKTQNRMRSDTNEKEHKRQDHRPRSAPERQN